ncbi:6-phosphofructo-2-kinase/fructose-2,6-bisphosphatase-like [Gossypium arboreum]|uniref:6-phosphofructo-2-kinase/fructose-2, 6-bisphosphatase-like n=1 Tax=Gossypium arboreum TaxID=29729 RepID=UPI0022F1AC9A|nr:6-phosphofructo-2-kinase/fructose-2,6-bisphosphatase-like [Gossypium arboreum]XP_052881646.1 6-phosphofructo-2-kinase/fructose-2,6-bisphosphatase-like [Gossypium arboreum]
MVDKYKLTTSVAIFLDESSSSCDTGEIYMKKLANFVEKRLKSERTASEKPTTLDCGPRTICKRHIMTSSNLYECLWEALQQRIRMITCS